MIKHLLKHHLQLIYPLFIYRMNKISLLLFTITTLFYSCNAQEKQSSKIKWTSFEEAVKLSEKVPKKLFIDVYTDWCGWCKKMDASTFQNDSIAHHINKNYYAVKLNAETKDTIRFRDNQFVYKPEYKANELALSLLGGKMGYPTYVFLDENFAMLGPASGFMQPEDLTKVLTFYTNEIYKTKKWEEYEKEVFQR
jgi:thioredoxin-related protein